MPCEATMWTPWPRNAVHSLSSEASMRRYTPTIHPSTVQPTASYAVDGDLA
jgi:hypothetical protein